MKNVSGRLISSLTLILFLGGCFPSPVSPTSTPRQAVSELTNPTSQLISSPTNRPTASFTPEPSLTLLPTTTDTPQPSTLLASPESTLRPQPEIVFSPASAANSGPMAFWGRGVIQQRNLAAGGQVWVVLSPLGLYLYSTQTLDLITQIEDVQIYQISPNGQILATVDSAHQIGLYRLVDGQKLISLPSPWMTESDVTALRFSADGTRLAAGYSQPAILVWDLETGQVDDQLQHAIMPAANRIEFSADGKYLANNTSSGILGLWSLAEDRLLWRTANGGRLTDASFLPDGRQLLSKSSVTDQMLILDLNSGNLNQTIQAANLVEYLNFSQDGGSLFFLTRRPQSGRYLIEQRSVRDGKLETFAEFTANYAIAPDRLSLAGIAEDGHLLHFNLRSWELKTDLATTSQPAAKLIFSYSGEALAAVSQQAFSLWDYPQMELREMIESELPLFNLHINSLLGLQLVGEGHLLAYGLDGQNLFVWDVFDEHIERYNLPERATNPPALAPNGRYLAVCTADGLYLFTLTTSEPSLVTRCRSPGLLVFSKDSTRLAQASGLQIDLLNLPAGTRIRYLAGNTLEILSMIFSPDGSYFASGTKPERGGAESVVWDFSQPLFPMRLPVPSFGVESLAFSGDNQYLATGGGDDKIRLWRVADGWLLRVRALEGSVSSLTFSPEDQIVAVGLSNGDLQLLNVPDVEPLALLKGHAGRITGLAFSGDGKALYSASSDGTIRLWGIPEALSDD